MKLFQTLFTIMSSNSTTTLYDVLVIGAGPAGLSVATGLVRQLHTAVVFDSGIYRNARAQHMHNVLGWDHRKPAELRAKGRADILARYDTIRFEDVGVQSVKKVEEKGVFEAVDAKGVQWYGRKIVLATGVKDVFLDIDGFEDLWADGIYHCLFCDGYEERAQKSVGVLAMGPVASNVPRTMHVSRMAKQLSESVTIYTGGNESLAKEIQEAAVTEKTFVFDNREIKSLEKRRVGDKKSVLVHFADGSTKEEGFLVYGPASKQNSPFAEQLGLKLSAAGDIETTQPFYESSVPGVYAVGDCATPMKAVSPAIAMGCFAAAGVSAALQAQPAPLYS